MDENKSRREGNETCKCWYRKMLKKYHWENNVQRGSFLLSSLPSFFLSFFFSLFPSLRPPSLSLFLCLFCLSVDTLTSLAGGFPGGSVVKNPPANAGDVGLIPGSERSLGEGNGNPLQYSCLENPMDRGAWQTIVHGVSRLTT